MSSALKGQKDGYQVKSTIYIKGTIKIIHPAQVMVLGIVTSSGITGASVHLKIWRITGYCRMKDPVLPCLKENYREGIFVWIQNSVPNHRAQNGTELRQSLMDI